MTQVSRRFIQKNTQDKIDQLFLESVSSCNNKELITDFLDDLLTSTEKIMLSKRLAIAYLLHKGLSYREIADILKVSNPTIRTVSLILHFKGKGLNKILAKVIQKQHIKNFLKELAETAIDILQEGKGGDLKEAKRSQYQRKLEKQSPL